MKNRNDLPELYYFNRWTGVGVLPQFIVIVKRGTISFSTYLLYVVNNQSDSSLWQFSTDYYVRTYNGMSTLYKSFTTELVTLIH